MNLKKIAYQLALNPGINLLIVGLGKIFVPIIPRDILRKTPVRGIVSDRLRNGKLMRLKSEGKDPIASIVFFQGIYKYEPEVTDLIERISKSCDVFVDVGANTGFYTILSKLTNPELQVYAFEPVPNTLNALSTNVALNNLTKVQTIGAAINDYDGETSIYIPPNTLRFSLIASTRNDLHQNSGEKDLYQGAKQIKVPSLTLDSFVSSNNLNKVDLIKIDTEGTEHKVLAGAKQTIARDRPLIICEVLSMARNEDSLTKFLQAKNYQAFSLTNRGLVSKQKVEGNLTCGFNNYLFLPKELKNDSIWNNIFNHRPKIARN